MIGVVAVIAAVDATLQFRLAAKEERLNLEADVLFSTYVGQYSTSDAYLTLRAEIVSELGHIVSENSLLVLRDDPSSRAMLLADSLAFDIERKILLNVWKRIPLDGSLTPQIRDALSLNPAHDLPAVSQQIADLRNGAADHSSRGGRAALALFVAAAAGALFALVGITHSGRAGTITLVVACGLLLTSVGLTVTSLIDLG